jgi:hypothetical protein
MTTLGVTVILVALVTGFTIVALVIMVADITTVTLVIVVADIKMVTFIIIIIIITWRYSPSCALASCAIRLHWSLS